METPSKEEISKQLIISHNVEKQEKKLLKEIIEGYPGWVQLYPSYQQTMQNTNFAIYTPEYFKNLIQVLEIFKKTGNATQHEETLKQQAILYITYVGINNEQWPTIKDKLSHINNCFQQYTLSYLQETWERYRPKIVVSVIPSDIEEPQYATATIEEIFSDEEEGLTIPEKPTPSIETPILKKEYKKTVLPSEQPQQPQEPKTGWLTKIWNSIYSFLENIYYFFTFIQHSIFGDSDIEESSGEQNRY
jgi:hypothetical protein